MRALRKLAISAGVLSGAAYGTAYYAFPEVRGDQKELFHAAQRSSRFIWTAIRLAYLYKISGLEDREKNEKGADLVYDCLRKNGGLSIKFGQSIGINHSDRTPTEYVNKMSRFYENAKESSFEDVKSQIEGTSGKKIEDMFENFDNKPISAASIAQVHTAYLKNGQKVAVKVQHKWLKEQFIGDLKILTMLVQIGEFFFPEFRYKWYCDELRKMLVGELDFENEANNARKTKAFFKSNPSIYVPKVYGEYSNDKVLVMEFVNGVAINKTKEIKEMGIDLKDVAKLLNHCFSQQIFEFGHVHGDPHPGNLYISPRKEFGGKVKPVLTLLDHGLYQTLTDDMRINYAYLWKGILTRNEELIRKAAVGLGVEKFYELLAMMVAKKDYKSIMDNRESDMNRRLRKYSREEEDEIMKKFRKDDIMKDIVNLFIDMDKSILLLFKVNDFIRVLTSRLGSPVKQYEIMAKYCFDSVEKKEFEKQRGFTQRFRFWFQRFSTLVAFKVYGFYYSILSMFKTPEVPDHYLF